MVYFAYVEKVDDEVKETEQKTAKKAGRDRIDKNDEIFVPFFHRFTSFFF